MNIKNQVCTLDQSVKLYELGITQNSLFYFNQELTPKNSNLCLFGYPQESIPVLISLGKRSNLNRINLNNRISGGDSYFFEYSAFNESELAIMLDAFYETFRTIRNTWHGGQEGTEEYDTPSQASASRLIWHLENDERLTASACNERLNEFLK